jgi:hypothetical protein
MSTLPLISQSLRSALSGFMAHRDDCAEVGDQTCDCGFEETLARVDALIMDDGGAAEKARAYDEMVKLGPDELEQAVIRLLARIEHENAAVGRANVSDDYRQGGRETTRGLINSHEANELRGLLQKRGWVPPSSYWRRLDPEKGLTGW